MTEHFVVGRLFDHMDFIWKGNKILRKVCPPVMFQLLYGLFMFSLFGHGFLVVLSCKQAVEEFAISSLFVSFYIRPQNVTPPQCNVFVSGYWSFYNIGTLVHVAVVGKIHVKSRSCVCDKFCPSISVKAKGKKLNKNRRNKSFKKVSSVDDDKEKKGQATKSGINTTVPGPIEK